MKKIVNPTMHEGYGAAPVRGFCKIEFENGKLSICGVIGPTRNGNCKGSAGQCVDEIREGKPAEGWTDEMIRKFCDIWDAWHLNNMRPYCEHQKQLGWGKLAGKEVNLYNYTLIRDAVIEKNAAEKCALKALENGETFTPTPEQVKFASLPYSIQLPTEISGEDAAYLKESPLAQVEKPQPKKTEAAFLEVSSVRELISELNRSAPFKYLAPIQFDMLTGMRRGEILGLRWSDVCTEESILRIQNTLNYVSNGGVYTDTPKNSTSVRYMKLPAAAVVILQKCLEWQHRQSELLGDKWSNPDGLVFTNEFGSYIHPDTLTHWFTAFAKKNGYEGIHLHSLRHTCASIMIADNVPTVAVSRYLGHAQVSTTQNIYSHMLAKAAASAADAYDKFSDLIK